MLIAWAGILLAALRFDPDRIYLFSSLIAIAVATGYTLKKDSALSPYMKVALLALITSLAYGSATLCFNNYLSDNRSSRRALQLAKQLVPTKVGVKIGFAYYFPFSAYFYTPKIFGPESVAMEVEAEQLASSEVDLIIVRKRNLERLMRDLPQLKELGRLGQWRILAKG
jgi:hypothetical protein